VAGKINNTDSEQNVFSKANASKAVSFLGHSVQQETLARLLIWQFA
jgi:hypothetical protein